MTEVEQPQTNGINIDDVDDANKSRPADIEAVSFITNHDWIGSNWGILIC